MKIDIGCGNIPLGDINCDLKKYPLNIKNKNFVLCDSQYLPFRSLFFDKVYSSHVIEHVKNPYKFLYEVIRVCKNNGIIYLYLPHRFSFGAKYKGHIHFFTRRWFEENIKYPFKCSITYWSPFKFFLFFPNEIQLKIFKRRN